MARFGRRALVTIDGRCAHRHTGTCAGDGRDRTLGAAAGRGVQESFRAVVECRRRRRHRRGDCVGRRAHHAARQAVSSAIVTVPTAVPVADPASHSPPRERVHPTLRLILRWALISALTGIAFHESLYSIGLTAHVGGLGGFAWTVPTVAVLVAVGVARRHRTELPIHDRQVDIIVGTMGLVLALLMNNVLLHRYSLYFHLLRLDLLAMWLFVLCSSIVLFGLRPVSRFGW